MVDIPHFALPFRFELGGSDVVAAAVTEQDSVEEIADCVECTIRTVAGERTTLPEFGRPETLEFTINRELARAQLTQALNEAEPRAISIVQGDDVDPADPGVLRLRAMFSLVERPESR